MFYEIYVKQGEDWILAECGLDIIKAAELCELLERGGHELRVRADSEWTEPTLSPAAKAVKDAA